MHSKGELSNSLNGNINPLLEDEDGNLSMQIMKVDERTDKSSGDNDSGMFEDEKMKKWIEDPATALQVLEDQLLDNSLLEFWQTGGMYKRCTNMNPDEDELCDVNFNIYMLSRIGSLDKDVYIYVEYIYFKNHLLVLYHYSGDIILCHLFD